MGARHCEYAYQVVRDLRNQLTTPGDTITESELARYKLESQTDWSAEGNLCP